MISISIQLYNEEANVSMALNSNNIINALHILFFSWFLHVLQCELVL